jgi:hypothetical protein
MWHKAEVRKAFSLATVNQITTKTLEFQEKCGGHRQRGVTFFGRQTHPKEWCQGRDSCAIIQKSDGASAGGAV